MEGIYLETFWGELDRDDLLIVRSLKIEEISFRKFEKKNKISFSIFISFVHGIILYYPYIRLGDYYSLSKKNLSEPIDNLIRSKRA